MKSGIYKIINKKNNVVYVGQSENLNTRFNRHIYRLKRNEHHNESMQRAFNKHGEDIFEYEIIEEVEELETNCYYIYSSETVQYLTRVEAKSKEEAEEKFWEMEHGNLYGNDILEIVDSSGWQIDYIEE